MAADDESIVGIGTLISAYTGISYAQWSYAGGEVEMDALREPVSRSARKAKQATATDRAVYIRDALIEIKRFADDEELIFLRYLLSMALEEANVSVVTTTRHPAQ